MIRLTRNYNGEDFSTIMSTLSPDSFSYELYNAFSVAVTFAGLPSNIVGLVLMAVRYSRLL